jgi:YidC/Oxa1 family membrane protein insertase
LGAIWSSLIGLVEQVLVFLYGFTHNYGVAIILLTIIIRVLMYPLMQKQMTSMRETQKIQPLMQEIQRKYKNDKEKMNQELMRLYKEHKVNPMGGCLPLIVQMPILILFFQVLREFEYHIPNTNIIDGDFLWIKNTAIIKILENGVEIEKVVAGLAAPDQLFGILPESVPMIGGTPIGILPILVGASMYFQQKLTTPAMPVSSQTSSSSSPAAGTQKMMTTIMPLMIGFISFTLPSGLSLYWFTSTLFGIGQQMLINKKETIPKNIIEKMEEETQKDVKPKTKEVKEYIGNKIATVEEEIPWIPGYENPVSQQNKTNGKKGKPKKKKNK